MVLSICYSFSNAFFNVLKKDILMKKYDFIAQI